MITLSLLAALLAGYVLGVVSVHLIFKPGELRDWMHSPYLKKGTWEWAEKKLKKDCYLRRRNWHDESYLVYIESAEALIALREAGYQCMPGMPEWESIYPFIAYVESKYLHPFTPGYRDTIADDWEVR